MAEATTVRVASPSYQAYEILHVGFTVLPIARYFRVLG